MKLNPQQRKIVAQLKTEGRITTQWAIDNKVSTKLATRLGELRELGWDTERVGFIKGTKNSLYVLKSAPVEKKVEWVLVVRDGREVRVPRLVEASV